MLLRKSIDIYHSDTKFPYQLSSKLHLKHLTHYVAKLLIAPYFNYKFWPDLKFKSYACDNAQLRNYATLMASQHNDSNTHVSVSHVCQYYHHTTSYEEFKPSPVSCLGIFGFRFQRKH
jgi:hypothetical protein